MVKVFLANVGVNRSDEKRGMMSPLFPNNTFEFIPIKEENKIVGENIPTYLTIKAFNSNNSLARYLPEKVHKYRVHNDPEFVTFTYGDVTHNSRSYNLLKIQKNDYLFFLARLTPYRENLFHKSEGNFFLIGYFLIEGIYRTEQDIYDNVQKIQENAHYKRYQYNYEEIGSFLILKGDTNKSRRFIHPIRVDRSFCDNFLLDAQGRPYNWKENPKLENQRIGSYTRTIRAVLDSQVNLKKLQSFLNYIESK